MLSKFVYLPLLAMAAIPLAAAAQEAPVRTITVTGEGLSERKPDMAVVSLGVSQQADTAAAAMAAMGTGLESVLAALADAGIAPADIQTGQLTLEAAYNYDTGESYPPVVGYIATEVVNVRVREVAQVGPLLDAVTAGGANRVNGITFVLDDQAAALEDARVDAVADARARAETYAAAADAQVGDLVRIVEGGASVGPIDQARFDMAASVPVAPGTVGVSATVSVTFELD